MTSHDKAMNKKALVRKLLMEPVDLPTLAPLGVGAVLGLGAWALNVDAGLALAGGMILALVSAGIYLHRLVFGWEENYEKTVAQWRAEVEQARDAELDELYRALSEDGDPRTEALLKDLRTLTRALMTERSESLALSAFDILADVDKLFKRCVDYLRESLELWRTSNEMERESLNASLLEHRETLIGEVEKSLENLGDVVGRIKRASVYSGDGQELAELRDELSARLAAAEDVETRMRRMRDGAVTSEDEDEYLKHAPE